MAKVLETPTVLIEAPAEVVWATLIDFDSHQHWNSYVVHWSGEARVGCAMRLVAAADKRREFHPTVVEVVFARRLRYVHRVLGGIILSADHEMCLEPESPSRCRFLQRERSSGLVLPFAWKAISGSAGPGFGRMNLDLKREAERRIS